ncbi:DUF2076 domain-containing protein [Aureimonas mangrovi]|uniref:DUF2076 domain-containing protein n=1 Tax=Aureimonas mangrovi TaxID=2758041 RepID=UPI00163D849C|nr:DUF2076 domain-containing protein [Aureimonas mangrovi]
MNRDEQGLIQNLFGKLSDAERTAPPRDPEADRFIQERVSSQPGAPYYMAQTIIVQEQALEAAQARIQELEAQASRSQGSGGGLFGSLFGGGGSQQPARASQPRSGGYAQAARPHAGSAGASGAWGGSGAQGTARQAGGGGGGFLAGAAQTAVGVAGGMMLGSMLGGLFDGENPIDGAGDALADAGDAVETEFADAGEAMGFDDFGGDEEL